MSLLSLHLCACYCPGKACLEGSPLIGHWDAVCERSVPTFLQLRKMTHSASTVSTNCVVYTEHQISFGSPEFGNTRHSVPAWPTAPKTLSMSSEFSWWVVFHACHHSSLLKESRTCYVTAQLEDSWRCTPCFLQPSLFWSFSLCRYCPVCFHMVFLRS